MILHSDHQDIERAGPRAIRRVFPGETPCTADVDYAAVYTEILAAAFTELAEYWRGTVIRSSQVKDERPLLGFSLPAEASSRPLLFAVPLTLLSFYRERVFRMAREHGFVLMSADDVVSPGDTVNAKIEALITRAQLFVVDTSTDNTASFRVSAAVKIPRARSTLAHPTGYSAPPDQVMAAVGSQAGRPTAVRGRLLPLEA
jgi:hypothetical protein